MKIVFTEDECSKTLLEREVEIEIQFLTIERV